MATFGVIRASDDNKPGLSDVRHTHSNSNRARAIVESN